MMEANQGYSYRLQLDRQSAGRAVVEFLATRFSHSTVSQWAERLRDGEVLCNGQPAHEAQELVAGDLLVWNRPGWIEEEVPRSYRRVFLDEHLLAVAKPSGLPTLPSAGFLQNTLLHLVRTDFPEARPLHRLGRGTSGLVLFALSREAAATVSREWRAVRKQYCGLSKGRAAMEEYDIRTAIGRVKHPLLGDVHAAHPNGKASRSVARVLSRTENTTLFEIDLHTGRPHQIRIHLASIGHPLLGDPMYACGGKLLENPGRPGELGYSLHAERLVLKHPLTGSLLDLHSQPPMQLRLHTEDKAASSHSTTSGD